MTDNQPTPNNPPRETTRRREKQTRYLSQAIQLEEAVNPHIIRTTMSMVSMAILVFLLWAAFTNINEIARSPGEVVPHGYQQTVQHLEGGMIRTIEVKEGDLVDAADILLTLDDAGIREDLQRVKSKQLALQMQEERLRAFVEGREPDFTRFHHATDAMIADQLAFFDGMRTARTKEAAIIKEQIAEKQQTATTLRHDLVTMRENYAIAKQMNARRTHLNKQGYFSDIQLFEDQQRLNDTKANITRLENQITMANTAIEEFEGRLASLAARHRDEAYEKLAQVDAEKSQNIEMVQKLQDRINRLEVRAPSRGLIKGLAVNTIGAVVSPGETLMEIVPLDKDLDVQVRISPKDIGHVAVGQPMQLKFSSYDFSRYGTVQGTLDRISATTFTGENDQRYYQGLIRMSQSHVGENTQNLILPGMTVMADIVTGEKTILQYLLKPIHLSIQTAFTER